VSHFTGSRELHAAPGAVGCRPLI